MSGAATQTGTEAFLAATDRLIEAIMDARAEYRDGNSTLATFRYDVSAAESEWSQVAWLSGWNAYAPD